MLNKFSIIIYVIISFLLFESCTNENSKENSATFQSKDNLKYKQLKGSFYRDKDGKLFEQKQYAVWSKGDFYDSQIYYDSIVFVESGDSIIKKSLSKTIDIITYTEFEGRTSFSMDKNYVYYSYSNSGGEYRYIVIGANPKTFRPLSDYRYGIDDEHIFYQSKPIKHLNFKKHIILYSLDTSDYFIDYIKDDKFVFYGGDIIKGADAKTFKLVNKQEWGAEDKKYGYQCGQPIK